MCKTDNGTCSFHQNTAYKDSPGKYFNPGNKWTPTEPYPDPEETIA